MKQYSTALGILVGFFLYIAVSIYIFLPIPNTQEKVTVIPYYQNFVQAPSDLPKLKPIPLNKSAINSSLEQQFGLPVGILKAVHQKETSGRCNVESKANAKGCFQFTPITIKDVEQRFNYKFNPYSYKESAKAAAIKLNYLHKRFHSNYKLENKTAWALTLAAYNAGYGTVTRRGWAKAASHKQLLTIIDYRETRRYVQAITSQIFKQNSKGINHDSTRSI